MDADVPGCRFARSGLRLLRNLGASTALLGHRVFHETSDNCQNRAADAAANQLTNDGADVEPAASGARQRRDQRREDLSGAGAAERSRNRVSDTAEIVVFE